MRIHSDILTRADLHRGASPGVYVDSLQTGSRSRARGFTVRLSSDGSGGQRRLTNSGTYGAGAEYAATWDEWGVWIAELFGIDPDAIIGPYAGRADFDAQTDGRYAGRKDR